MRSDMTKPIRITVDLSPAAYGRLGKLSALCGSATNAQTVRMALQAYEYIATMLAGGGKLQKPNADGTTETLVIPRLQR